MLRSVWRRRAASNRECASQERRPVALIGCREQHYHGMERAPQCGTMSPRTRQVQIHSKINVQLVPNTIEQFAKFISNSPIPNEETRRRFVWFMYGLFLMKAEELAERDVSHEQSVQDIWNYLRQYRGVINNVLKENILWTDDEKDVGLRNVHRRHGM
jgi:hypothetical protein